MSTGVAFISPTLTALTSFIPMRPIKVFIWGSFRSSGSMARACGPLLAGLVYFGLGSSVAYLLGAVFSLFRLSFLLGVPQPVLNKR